MLRSALTQLVRTYGALDGASTAYLDGEAASIDANSHEMAHLLDLELDPPDVHLLATRRGGIALGTMLTSPDLSLRGASIFPIFEAMDDAEADRRELAAIRIQVTAAQELGFGLCAERIVGATEWRGVRPAVQDVQAPLSDHEVRCKNRLVEMIRTQQGIS